VIEEISIDIEQFLSLKKPPEKLYAVGNSSLLKQKLVSIVGTRRPISYTKEQTLKLSKAFSSIGYTVVSGAAMGVDAIAHRGALPNTIAVMANSLDIYYPKVNQKLIKDIYDKGLAISEYPSSIRATKYSFVIRNRLVVALGEILIIAEADLDSGTMRSAQIAKELGRKIYVLPHRLDQSLGTQKLLEEGDAELITDINKFVAKFGKVEENFLDEDQAFFQQNPPLQDALDRYGNLIYEYELEGKIEIKNLKVYLC
jgi:DNA processing protein